MIALDTNLLVYAHRSSLPLHKQSQRAIEKAAEHPGGWAIPFSCVLEFWAVVTHPASKPSTPKEARAFLASLVTAGAKILYPKEGTAGRLLDLALHSDVQGARIFDLQIGLTCRESGVRELWTHDRNFVSVPGLVVRDPL